MALIRLGGNIIAIKGKIGGTTYQTNLAGQVAKQKCAPPNSNTPRQQAARQTTFELVQLWTSLTVDQRNNWEGWAQYMQRKQKRNSGLFIDGRQAFLQANNVRLRYGLAALITPLYNKCDLLPVTLNLRLLGATLLILSTRTIDPLVEFLAFSISMPLPVTWNNSQGTPKLLIFPTVAGLSQDITIPYTALFGAVPTAGDTVFIKYTTVDLTSGRILPYKATKQSPL